MRHFWNFLFLMGIAAGILMSCNKDDGPYYTSVAVEPVNLADSSGDTNAMDDKIWSFAADIQPVFTRYCITCHSEVHAKLNLKSGISYEQLKSTGFNAPYIDENTPEKSRLYRHLTGDLLLMPPNGKLGAAQIEMVKNWMEQGGNDN